MKDLKDKEKVREWASRNAYSLIFLGTMFIITWTWIFVTRWI